MMLALIGNQNCGKTTLFNQLTGSNQHVGNFPGVTVDKKIGMVKNYENVRIVDLPGIYSMSPYSNEEIVTRDFLIEENVDAIINIIDATNIERNLYLSLQLMELGIPMVIALNMMDEVRNNGGTIHIHELSNRLGVPVVPISASKNEGVSALMEMVYEVATKKIYPRHIDFCTGPVHRAIHSISHQIEDHCQKYRIPRRFGATKIVEGEDLIIQKLHLSENEIELVEHSVKEMEDELQIDRYAALADMRYNFIEGAVKDIVIKGKTSKERERSIKIDSILTHRYFAIPIFIFIMLMVFWLSFDVIGQALSDILSLELDKLICLIDSVLTHYGLNSVMKSLIVDGALAGIASVLSFLPVVVTLFFFLSLLEDSGYMARVAFVMDKPLRKLGLSGRSFVPLLIGFGCSVPAIMSTRTLSSQHDRKMTMMLVPFMSCSAKLPIYAVFTAAFFASYAPLVMMGLYLFGMVMAVICGLILNKIIGYANPVPFVMELPNYRFPSGKSVLLLVWDKAKDFLVKAFTVIFLASLVIWFLQTFDIRFNVVDDTSNSMLALVGQILAPIFKPLGFADWKIATALVTGFSAKEAVVSTLAVLTKSGMDNLGTALTGLFSPLSAFSFLIFTLLYTPCIAAISSVAKELDSKFEAVRMVLAQIAIAWICSYIVYHIGLLFF